MFCEVPPYQFLFPKHQYLGIYVVFTYIKNSISMYVEKKQSLLRNIVISYSISRYYVEIFYILKIQYLQIEGLQIALIFSKKLFTFKEKHLDKNQA